MYLLDFATDTRVFLFTLGKYNSNIADHRYLFNDESSNMSLQSLYRKKSRIMFDNCNNAIVNKSILTIKMYPTVLNANANRLI